jgi:hypothetical protein
MHVFMYVYIYIYTYIHTYIHTQTGLGDGSGQGEAVRVFAAMLRVNTHLRSIDMSSNSLEAEGGVVLRDSLEENSTVTAMDVRVNKVSA